MKKNTKLRLITIFIVLIALLFIGCPTSNPKNKDKGALFSVTSTAFNDGDAIPVAYRGNFGTGPTNPTNNPPLAISNLPAGTKSLVLWLLDTDSTNFAHWIIRNVPITKTNIAEGEIFTAEQTISTYFGPSPPNKHTYHFVVFALSDTTAEESTGTATETQSDIWNFYSTDADKIGNINVRGSTTGWNVLGTATLTGTFTP